MFPFHKKILCCSASFHVVSATQCSECRSLLRNSLTFLTADIMVLNILGSPLLLRWNSQITPLVLYATTKHMGLLICFMVLLLRWLVVKTTLLLGSCIQLLVCYPAIPERNRRSW